MRMQRAREQHLPGANGGGVSDSGVFFWTDHSHACCKSCSAASAADVALSLESMLAGNIAACCNSCLA